MKIVFKNTNIYPFRSTPVAEKHAADCARQIHSVFYLEGGLPIYSFYEDGVKIWADRSSNLPADFNPFTEN